MEGTFDETLQRAAGYQAALQKAGIDADARWLKQTAKISLSPSFAYLEWGRQHMRTWLEEGWRQLHCTAIIVQNDHAAIGVMQILQEEGIKVPEEVSVVGFDGTRVCDLVRPRLTSIQVPFYQMGYEAVKVLCRQMEQDPPVQQSMTVTLPVKLRRGDSVLTIN
jgi:LacI family transcriptional regulator